jgi:YggT family protein
VAILVNMVEFFLNIFRNIIEIYIYVIVARALISWVSPDPHNPIVRFLYNVTEPPLRWLRRLIPLQFSGIDLSPWALIFILYLIHYFIGLLISQVGLRFV